MFQYIRLKTLLNAILDAQSPEEVFRLTAEFIGDDTQVAGEITHKNLSINYHFHFDKINELLQMGLIIQQKVLIPVPTGMAGATTLKNWGIDTSVPPLLNFHLCVNKNQLSLLQAAIISFLSLLR